MKNPQHRLEVFDSSLQKTYLLLDDICRDLQWEGLPQQAYGALRAILHTLRDRLTVEEAVHLGAQLPMIVRGFYYDGWKPANVPKKMHKEEFLKEALDTFQFY